MDEKNPKNSLSHLKTIWALNSSFVKASVEKSYRIFRFCVHFTNQEGDFYEVFQFLVPGISEK